MARGSSRLFLDLDPNAVSTSVEERCLEQPDALAVIAEALCTQVEMPFAASQTELVSSCGGICWRRIDRIAGRHRIAVLDSLKRVDAGNQRDAEANRVELHWDGAVQLEGPDGTSKAASVSVFNRTTYWRKEAVEDTAGGKNCDRAVYI